MLYRVIWAILALVLSVPSTLLGQMKPFAKFPLSKESAVRAIQMGTNGDTSVLNIKASTLVETWNKAFGLHLENRDALVEYIRTMDVSGCPTEMGLSRLRPDGAVDMRGWDRKAHQNEQCLVKGGRVHASLYCFNTTPSLYLSNAEVLQFESPAPALSAGVMPDTMNVKVFGKVQLELSDADRRAIGIAETSFRWEGRHQRSWWSRNWGWPVGGTVVATAVGLIGANNGWWDRNITQCTVINSPGVCPNK